MNIILKSRGDKMREIKFRIWDKDLNIMSCDSDNILIMFLGKDMCISYDSISGDGTIKNYELMQCTGLKDKNEVNIYEGDILYYDFDEDCQSKGIVTYTDGCFCIDNDILYPLHSLNEIRVVGNIYENPELLED
jgi:uncharacterized phage protein (TIGR01671 family)